MRMRSRRRSSARFGSPFPRSRRDRKSTRLNSSHSQISYAVFCLKKKKQLYHHAVDWYYFNAIPPSHSDGGSLPSTLTQSRIVTHHVCYVNTFFTPLHRPPLNCMC